VNVQRELELPLGGNLRLHLAVLASATGPQYFATVTRRAGNRVNRDTVRVAFLAGTEIHYYDDRSDTIRLCIGRGDVPVPKVNLRELRAFYGAALRHLDASDEHHDDMQQRAAG
jgi:hypothetical protein